MTPEQQAKVEDWAEKCYRYKHRWLAYLKSLYGERFIREFGSPWRMLCETPEEMYNYIGHYNRVKLSPAFISVNGYTEKVEAPDRRMKPWKPMYDMPILTRAFFDFDGDINKGLNISQAHDEALRLAFWLEAGHPGYGVEVRFSGSKGFAVELRMPMSRDELARLNQQVKEMRLGTLDRITNFQQVYRIPYTIHQTSLRQVIPIRREWSLEEVFEQSMRFRPPPVVA